MAELFRRAEFRSALEQAIEQANLESIILKALPHLKESAKPQDMDNDWIKNHIQKSRHTSAEEMQEWWAKILAGEANRPGSYSKRAVNVLGDLEQPEAQAFNSLCDFVWDIEGSPIPLIYDSSHSVYTDSGVNHATCTYLAELGLVNYTPPIESYMTLDNGAVVMYCGHQVQLEEITNRRGLCTGSVNFTITGIQLFRLCDIKPIEGLIKYVFEEWGNQRVSFVGTVPPGDEEKVGL